MANKTKHTKGDIIRHQKKYWQCICVDSEIAVFAPITKSRKYKDFTQLHYRDMFACSPSYKHLPLLNFEFIKNKTK